MAKSQVIIGTVRISPELNELLEQFAWDQGMSKNSVIVEALDRMLKGIDSQNP